MVGMFRRWNSKRDVVFSRQWFRGQDGTYTILQFPIAHKKCPPKSGYRRTEINPSTWEIRGLNTSFGSNGAKCLVTQMLEIHSVGWRRWKQNKWTKFEKTVPYALLSQVAGSGAAILAQAQQTFMNAEMSQRGKSKSTNPKNTQNTKDANIDSSSFVSSAIANYPNTKQLKYWVTSPSYVLKVPLHNPSDLPLSHAQNPLPYSSLDQWRMPP
ncbi:ENHANCED DISEASE RESISTANCE protein [Actinidia rufa]|uniref:ENHANCED DISEASE RESISTANCE protein n=1 Tax=Actinidia rufa TaxID=165716 RepID=A0A7J0FNC6_9ERIC|nr:ENHANCED DISEASE RESISTANCE protein [Actinidia rufa]